MVFECLPCKKANRIPFSWEKLSRKRNHKKVCRSKPSKNKSKVKDGVSALAFGSSPSDFALLSSIFLQAGVMSAEKTLKSRDPRLQKKVRVKKQEETLGPMAGDQLFPGYCYVHILYSCDSSNTGNTCNGGNRCDTCNLPCAAPATRPPTPAWATPP